MMCIFRNLIYLHLTVDCSALLRFIADYVSSNPNTFEGLFEISYFIQFLLSKKFLNLSEATHMISVGICFPQSLQGSSRVPPPWPTAGSNSTITASGIECPGDLQVEVSRESSEGSGGGAAAAGGGERGESNRTRARVIQAITFQI